MPSILWHVKLYYRGGGIILFCKMIYIWERKEKFEWMRGPSWWKFHTRSKCCRLFLGPAELKGHMWFSMKTEKGQAWGSPPRNRWHCFSKDWCAWFHGADHKTCWVNLYKHYMAFPCNCYELPMIWLGYWYWKGAGDKAFPSPRLWVCRSLLLQQQKEACDDSSYWGFFDVGLTGRMTSKMGTTSTVSSSMNLIHSQMLQLPRVHEWWHF